MEPWRAVNAHNGGVEAQNEAVEGSEAVLWIRIRSDLHRFAGSGQIYIVLPDPEWHPEPPDPDPGPDMNQF